MMKKLRRAGRSLAWLGVILTAALFPSLSPTTAAGPFTVPAVSKMTGTVPGFDTHIVCLNRSETDGSQVVTWSVCYGSDKPAAPPPPPPPPFEAQDPLLLIGNLDEATGELTVPVFGCSEFFPGTKALSMEIVVSLDKGGGPASGSITVVTDTTAPFDCVDGIQFTGPLTYTPLALDHDEDQDGCTDWEELGTNELLGGRRDPFNFWDFYDTERVWSPKSVGFLDLNALLQRFNTTDNNKTAPINRNSDPLTTPDPGPGVYHPLYDRGTFPIPGGDPWDEGPPDGAIGFLDMNAMLRQLNTSCVPPP